MSFRLPYRNLIPFLRLQVITVEFSNLHAILKTGSALYRKYLERRSYQAKLVAEPALREDEISSTPQLLDKALRCLNVSELLNANSAFRKFSAVQKRHLECLAEGPVYFNPGERLWRAGAPVDKAFLIVSGSASFVPKRRNAGSAGVPSFVRSYSVSGVVVTVFVLQLKQGLITLCLF